MVRAFLLLVFLLLTAPLAFAEGDEGVKRDFLTILLSGDFMVQLIPVVIGFQVILYGVAEGLTRIAAVTENRWDNKIAHFLGEAAWMMGVVIGKFGYSVPRLVIDEKAKEAAKKDQGEVTPH